MSAYQAAARIHAEAERMKAVLEDGGVITLHNLRWLKHHCGEKDDSWRSALSMCNQLLTTHRLAHLTARLMR